MDKEELKCRTKEFAKAIILLCRLLPDNRDGRLIGNQLFRCGTSVAANYRAACRARSAADFISKMGIVLEEADESAFWLELISETNLLSSDKIKTQLNEANELIAIFVTSINTIKNNQKNKS